MEPDREYLVLASSIPPLHRWSTLRMFRGRAPSASNSCTPKGWSGSHCSRDLGAGSTPPCPCGSMNTLSRRSPRRARTASSWQICRRGWGRRSSCDGRSTAATAYRRGVTRSGAWDESTPRQVDRALPTASALVGEGGSRVEGSRFSARQEAPSQHGQCDHADHEADCHGCDEQVPVPVVALCGWGCGATGPEAGRGAS